MPDLTFTGVTIYDADKVFVTAMIDQMVGEGTRHSLILKWVNGSWSQTPVAQVVIGACVVNEAGPKLICVCDTGEVKLLLAAGTSVETIDSSEDGPTSLMTLRTAKTIGGKVYAAGMARRFYSRAAPGRWEAIDNGVFLPRNQRKETVGFLCIDGLDASNIFAAGYKGEIWHYDGKGWAQQESPTKAALTSLSAGSDGTVYIAGMAGTLIRGTIGSWEVVKQVITQDDFLGGTIFKGIPYFATHRSLYRLQKNRLEPVDFGSLGSITTGRLDCNSEVLWSVGAKHIATTRDGKSWEAISGPS